ncbi:transcriptional regulator [Serratia oryzae]|uniref:CadC family transcriptional regulator n=1 Tax=Serratia oryzae TaxID=2034155 RepID=A0A1S8CEH4_9GAMM|nr:winged helix-turn-helix domain-containing protein [Serratia oryzae]OMQ20027.1 CadC family transcriptional regulator [Serratia oryzae]VXC90957.1 CadC family transcriptional regulator [Enterobacterales bacterium 8AC]
MKYKFNDTVLFDADTGTLGPSDLSDDPIPISNPTKRLLLLLIAHHGEPVNREVIFKKVWDDYGMISSNNNLNQCVSKLRRVIKVMGIDDEVIATVPKLGFMLRQEILIESNQGDNEAFTQNYAPPVLADEPDTAMEDEPDMNESEEVNTEVDDETEPTPEVAPTASKRRYGWAIVTALSVFVFILGIGITMYTTNSLARQEVFLGSAGSCKVFLSTSTTSGVPGPSLNKDLLAYVAQRSMECQADEYLLVVRSNQVRSYISGIHRMFFVRCTTLREHRIEFCSGMENDNIPLLR